MAEGKDPNAVTVYRFPRQTRVFNGRKISFVDVGAGPAVVLLHGIGMSSLAWEDVLGELARSHRVLAIDLPGFGGSDRLGWTSNLQPYADQVLTLLDELGIDDVALVGHSMGGLVAQRAAVSAGSQVSKLVLVCSAGAMVDRRRLAAVAVSLAAFHAVICSRPVMYGISHVRPLRRGFVRWVIGGDGPTDLVLTLARGYGSSGFYRALTAAYWDRWSSLSTNIACPTLVMWGDRDPLLPLRFGQQLATSIPAAEFVVFNDSGHAPQLSDPDRWLALVRQFLDPAETPQVAVG